jgi:beta-galactosidase
MLHLPGIGLDTPEPGEVRLMTYACLARGADGLLYFRWRSCRFGAEIYWRGILDHDDIPRRAYREIAEVGGELQNIGREILGTSVRVDVGIAHQDVEVHDAHTAHGLGMPAPAQFAEDVHGYFYQRGYAVGCVHPADDLAGLKLYIIPHWALFDPAWVPDLEAWVREGGTLVIGARTATRDLNNNVIPETIPGCLRTLAGVTVEEYGNQIRPDQRPLAMQLAGETISTNLWYEGLNLEGDTEAFATWSTRHLAGTPAISRRRLGKGNVLYVATYLTPEVIAAIGPKLVKISCLQPLWPVPEGVEVVCRENDAKCLWFFLNHTEETVTIDPAPAGKNLITGKAIAEVVLEPRNVAVIKYGKDS